MRYVMIEQWLELLPGYFIYIGKGPLDKLELKEIFLCGFYLVF